MLSIGISEIYVHITLHAHIPNYVEDNIHFHILIHIIYRRDGETVER